MEKRRWERKRLWAGGPGTSRLKCVAFVRRAIGGSSSRRKTIARAIAAVPVVPSWEPRTRAQVRFDTGEMAQTG